MITKEQLECYQKEALRTFKPSENALEVAALGLAGECTEIAKMGWHLRVRHFAGKDKLAEELGDLCWYIAISFHICGLDAEFTDLALWNRPLYPGVPLEDLLELVMDIGVYCELVKKKIGHGHPFAPEESLKAIALSFAALVECLDLDLFTLMQLNSAKLRQRYPDGFSHEASINRTR